MIAVSKQYKKDLYNGNRNFQCFIDMTLKNGTILKFDNSQIWEGGFKYEDTISSSDSFEIGSAIMNKLTFTINNLDDRYSLYDFDDANIVAYIGLALTDGTFEKIKKGAYVVDNAIYNGITIELECLDRMKFLDRTYETELAYPTTLGQIVYDACLKCNVPLKSASFFNSNYIVNTKPAKETTFREMIAYVSQLSSSYARFNNEGQLEFIFFDKDVFSFNSLDGGTFKKYDLENVVDGGDFNFSETNTVIDGGTFQDANKYHHLYSNSSVTVNTEETEITGFKLVVGEGEEAKEYFSGKEGYVILIENNPLAQTDLDGLVSRIAGRIVGFKFRTFNVQSLSDPSIEASDPVMISDLKGNAYYSYITSLSFEVGNFCNFECNAKTKSEQAETRYNVATKNLIAIKNQVNQQISNFGYEFNQFNNLISNAMGFYTTKTESEDKSVILYLHEKPELENSQTIWKISVDGFAVSLDGGKTWTTGITKNGNIIANVLSVVGINADWINAGSINAININGSTIKGSYIESQTGNNSTIINNGMVITNNIVLPSVNKTSGFITPSQIILYNSQGSSFIELNADTGQIKTHNFLSVGNATFRENEINLLFQEGKDRPVINGFEIPYRVDLNQYVTGEYFNQKDLDYHDKFLLKVLAEVTYITKEDAYYTFLTQNTASETYLTKTEASYSYMPLSKVFNTTDIKAITSGSYGTINFAGASAAGNLRVSRLEERVAKLETASDLRLKKDIKALDDIKSVYMNFKPYTYRYKSDLRGDNIHSGLIAQQVISNLENNGYNANDFGLVDTFIPYEKSNENEFVGQESYCINYNNLHAWHIKMIQEQQKEIDCLKEENQALKTRLDEIERLIKNIRKEE